MDAGLQPGRPREPSLIWMAPGLDAILAARQIGLFPAFRAAMLEDASRETALRGANWLGRDSGDFAVMLTEMFAYVCDVLAFYDGLIANESCIRTAARASAVRKLTGLIGYIPRPAAAAMADLALSLDGRSPVEVPAGAAFRSSSFAAKSGQEKPQVFTAMTGGTFHPLRARFTLTAQPAASLGGASGGVFQARALTFRRGSVTVKAPGPVLARTGAVYAAALVDSVENTQDAAGYPVARVTFSNALNLAGGTPISEAAVQRPTQTAYVNGAPYTYVSGAGYLYNGVYLDAHYKSIKPDDMVLLRKGAFVRWFRVAKVDTYDWTVQAAQTITSTYDGKTLSTSAPAVKTAVSKLTFDAAWDDAAHRSPGDSALWSWSSLSDLTFYFGMTSAGALAGEAEARIGAGSVLKVKEKVEAVDADYEPEKFILRDLDGKAAAVDGALSTSGILTVGDADAHQIDFAPPVTVYGAILRTVRGERVENELLGVGDGSVPGQSFKLKKKPLTYIGAADSETGVRSTLEIYVDGVKWREAPRFYGRGPDEHIYIVRRNDQGESLVTFGDGISGKRLKSGARVLGGYYFGAGEAAPPATAITQMVAPIKGVKAVVNPLDSFGGSDAEEPSNLKRYAPRSALMLGRAVSLADYEAAAAATDGVRAARAEWRWSGTRQCPVVKIWYIGKGETGESILERLTAVSAEGTPFEIEAAEAIRVWLHVSLEIDPDWLADLVAGEVTAVLSAALAPEKVGVGAVLTRSRILALAAGVEGVVAPKGVYVNGHPHLAAGYRIPAGKYVEFVKITAGP